jgi:hypothetical protein
MVQVLHTISLNVSPDMRQALVNSVLNSKFEDIANGRSNTLAAGLTQLLHDWESLFGYAPPVEHIANKGNCVCSVPLSTL